MKKGIAVLLALLCMVAFAGCSGDPKLSLPQSTKWKA